MCAPLQLHEGTMPELLRTFVVHCATFHTEVAAIELLRVQIVGLELALRKTEDIGLRILLQENGCGE